MNAAERRQRPRTTRLWRRTLGLLRNIPKRLDERAFWLTQVGVAVSTITHVAAEAATHDAVGELAETVHHVPALLYVVPIAYASLRYGTEGALLTGLWSLVLTVPNLLAWHRDGFEWVVELAYVAVVVSVGVVMALPVERERGQRHRAEATSRRLALLHDLATLTLTRPMEDTLERALEQLHDLLPIDLAAVVLDGDDGPRVLASRPERVDPAELLGATAVAAGEATVEQVVAVTLTAGTGTSAGQLDGRLVVRITGGPLTPEDVQLLQGVGDHLAVAIASAQLQRAERERVREYARHVTRAQEEERKRIAREVHDEATQNLVVIGRGLDELAGLHGDVTDHPARRLRALTGQTLAGLRRFIRDLRPPMLDDLGLAPALEALADEVTERSDLSCTVTVVGQQRRLPTDTELALFRVAQAALHNVERHAAAATAHVAITFDEDAVTMEITDDGRGFAVPADLAEQVAEGHVGLIGMQERASLVGGRLDIRSTAGRGTTIRLTVPG